MKTPLKHVFNIGDTIYTNSRQKTQLTYLGEIEKTPSGKRKVRVKCSCDKEWNVQLGNILNGSTVCCGKYPCRTYKYLFKNQRDPEVGYRSILYTYKKHALRRGFKFNLTYEQFKDLLNQNCHYCGIPPQQVYKIMNSKTQEIRSGVPILYNGIDRKDSLKDYTEDNVLTCCKVCNRAKMDLPYDEFLQWVNRIYTNLN